MNKLSHQCLVAIEEKSRQMAHSSFNIDLIASGMKEALTNSKIYKSAGLIEDDGEWFPLKAAQFLSSEKTRLEFEVKKYKTKWISINDALPEEPFQGVLVTDGSWIERGHKNLSGKLVWLDDAYYEDITHWMPLPELPKE